MKIITCVALAVLCAVGAAPAEARRHRTEAAAHPAAASEGPAFLGTFRDWSAYSRGSGDAKVCYALSQPKAQQPAGAKRDPAYFLVNDWPGRHSKGEAEVVPGYQYQDGSNVTVQIGSAKFAFFTKNEGRAGGAWVLNPSEEDRLLSAMADGITAVVTGTSRRGTLTKDVYGLTGFSSALDSIHRACGM